MRPPQRRAGHPDTDHARRGHPRPRPEARWWRDRAHDREQHHGVDGRSHERGPVGGGPPSGRPGPQQQRNDAYAATSPATAAITRTPSRRSRANPARVVASGDSPHAESTTTATPACRSTPRNDVKPPVPPLCQTTVWPVTRSGRESQAQPMRSGARSARGRSASIPGASPTSRARASRAVSAMSARTLPAGAIPSPAHGPGDPAAHRGSARGGGRAAPSAIPAWG